MEKSTIEVSVDLLSVLDIYHMEIYLLLLTYDILFQFHSSYKSCETRPVWGALTFQALWHFTEKLF